MEKDPRLEAGSVDLLKIRASTSGSWSNTYKFLSELESLSYKIAVDSLSLVSSKDGDSGSPQGTFWRSVFEIRVLKYK